MKYIHVLQWTWACTYNVYYETHDGILMLTLLPFLLLPRGHGRLSVGSVWSSVGIEALPWHQHCWICDGLVETLYKCIGLSLFVSKQYSWEEQGSFLAPNLNTIIWRRVCVSETISLTFLLSISNHNEKERFSTNAALLIFHMRCLHDSTMSSSGVWIIYFHLFLGLLFSFILTLIFLNFISLRIIKSNYMFWPHFWEADHYNLVLGKIF